MSALQNRFSTTSELYGAQHAELSIGSDPRFQLANTEQTLDNSASLEFIKKLKPKRFRFRFEAKDGNQDDQGTNYDEQSGNRVGFNVKDIFDDCQQYRDLINRAKPSFYYNGTGVDTNAVETIVNPSNTTTAGMDSVFENEMGELRYLDFIGYLVSAMQKQNELITNLETSLEISDKKLGHVIDFLNGK